MSPADRRLLKDLGGRPMFRCSGGWKRGSTKISTKKASELVASGAFRRAVSRRAVPMIVPTTHNEARKPSPPTKDEPVRAWWMND